MILFKKSILVLLILISTVISVKAQFWFGPVVGGHLTSSDFNKRSRRDTADVAIQTGFHLGLAMDYSTQSAFEVHTELKYSMVSSQTKIKKATILPFFDPNNPEDPRNGRINDLDGNFVGTNTIATVADSRFDHHFLTFPIVARMILFQRSKVKFMAEGGPQLRYWLGSSGTLSSTNIKESGSDQVNLKVSFVNDLPEVGEPGQLIVSNPNRLQYAFIVGLGGVYDITPERRLIVDVKFALGQSWMAHNNGNILFDDLEYEEDLQYTTNMLSVSAAYMIGWNPALNRKGRSTSGVGKKQRTKK